MVKQQFETGRSMVEIIATLAIVGVLSIAGIIGYSYAMNKYHAGAIFEDVNLRMVEIISQVYQGKQGEDIVISEELGERGESGYEIEVFPNMGSEPFIMVKQVPSRVCEMVLKDVLETQDVFVGTLNEQVEADARVDGNWYLGDNTDICGNDEKKEMLFSLDEEVLASFFPDHDNEEAPVVECQSNADCSVATPHCQNGRCIECLDSTDCIQKYGVVLPFCGNGLCTECPTETPVWNGAACEACPLERPHWNPSSRTCNQCQVGSSINPDTNECERYCRSNADCDTRTRYCRITNYSLANNVFSNMRGTCATKADLPDGVYLQRLDTTVYVIGSMRLNANWWSARNYCLSQGKRLFNISNNRLQCFNGNTPFDINNRVSQGPCCAQGITSCNQDGGFSELMQDLHPAAGGGWLWVDDPSENAVGAYSYQNGSIVIFSENYSWGGGQGRADRTDFVPLCEG
ncbi:MAG: hypothetical protein IKV03_00985 [Alphaproteobacteria bacterium]|nr:hypothetical protein [Alphaproteobacteria bacterium]